MLNYLVYAGAAIILFGGLLVWVAVAIGAGLTYLAMLSTSVYSWAAISQLGRERILPPALAVLYVILSLAFIADTVTGTLLFGHLRRRPLLALVIVLLSFGLCAACVGLTPAFILGMDVAMNVFDWAIVGGVAALIISVIISAALMPAVRREAQRLLLPATPEDGVAHAQH